MEIIKNGYKCVSGGLKQAERNEYLRILHANIEFFSHSHFSLERSYESFAVSFDSLLYLRLVKTKDKS